MFKEDSLKIPTRKFPSHKIISDAVFFIPENQFSYSKKIKFSSNTQTLQKNEEILVLEHAIGPEGKWLKIIAKIEDKETIGYVPFFNNVTPIDTVYPFYELKTDEKNLPNPLAPQINWKLQKPNIPYEDAYNGAYVVHVELENVTTLGNEDVVLGHMQEARIKGTKIILDYVGFKYNDNILDSLLNGFYAFSSAEEWYIDPRPCSTLRVAVAIPKRYLFSKNNSFSIGETSSQDEQIPPEYFTLKFDNYNQYKLFFDNIINELQKQQFLFTSREWIIDPDIKINFLKEIDDVKSFVRETDQLLAKNHPKLYSEIFSRWENSLDIIIDKQTLEVKNIKYYKIGDIQTGERFVRYSLGAGFAAYLSSPPITNKTIVNYLLKFPTLSNVEQVIENAVATTADTLASGFAADLTKQELKKFLVEKHYPSVTDVIARPLDLYKCAVDTVTRIKDLESIKIPSERRKWEQINNRYEKNKLNIEGDLFLRTIKQGPFAQDKNLRILFGIDTLTGTPEEKFNKYICVAQGVDWAKFLGVSTQCMTKNLPPETLLALLDVYAKARKSIDDIFSATICNPFLKNGLKIINGFQLPTFPAYNPNASLIVQLEAALYKILTDIVALGIKSVLEAAAKACTTDPSLNFNSKAPLPNLEEGINDPALNDLLDSIVPNGDRDEVKDTLKNIISDITACLSLQEMCALYKGLVVNEDVYQIISSLIKRKYGETYAQSFTTKDQIITFFRTIGNSLNLSVCDDQLPDIIPAGTSILCDDGRIKGLRRDILSGKDLTPDLIDDILNTKKQEEAKALEDVLKLLNSDNPFDFSKVPDLGCKVFPDGSTIAPSMESFTGLLNSLLNSIYDTFDQESLEWYKTTYSVSSSNNSFLQFNTQTGEVEPKENVTIDPNVTKKIKATNENNNDTIKNSQDLQDFKFPSYLFVSTINSNLATSDYVNQTDENLTYVSYKAALDGSKQQNLDLNIIENSLRNEIQIGESLLKNFCNALLGQILAKITVSAFDGTSIARLLYAMDSFLRSNIVDAEIMQYKLKNLYKQLNLDGPHEANALFAAENGAALYLVVCEELIQKRDIINEIINLASAPSQDSLLLPSSQFSYNPATTLNDLLGSQFDSTRQDLQYPTVLGQYEKVKNYYRTILKAKINYPDFDIAYNTGINKLQLSNGETYSAYSNNKFYEIQTIEVQKNKNNYIKTSEINFISSEIQSYISSLNIQQETDINKQKIFKKYFDLKRQQFGQPISIDGQTPYRIDEQFTMTYGEFSTRLFNNMKYRIFSKSNKFLYLKDLKNAKYASVIENGFGQPYTQYLKLVLEQTPEQKACNIRPHYLDIDSIKDQVLNEKANNVCVEKIADDRIASEKPINVNDLKDLETSSTQATMLRGMYRLTIRIFLHDLLLRSIAVFGHYDPQFLRDEPAFIGFMSKMAESEIRGMDNDFFIMLTNFLLSTYKENNPEETIDNEEVKKILLFKEVVGDELRNYVLPKLAKRIYYDTNLQLLNNKPVDIPIVLTTPEQDIINLDLLYEEGDSVYLKMKFLANPVDLSGNETYFPEGPPIYTTTKQKIYVDENYIPGSGPTPLDKFKATDEFKFLFKFMFPLSQALNNYFMINCLSTSTRRQVVNSFRSTKKDAIITCKTIQAGGQEITVNPNNSQALAMDPMELIIGFIFEALIKAPINILKGYAEATEPNIAIVSTAHKAARLLVPDLTSLIIPAVSIPLGTLPTPLTCPLPFTNPLLSAAYFSTLAWYDDKPIDKLTSDVVKDLEKFVDKNCETTINPDLFYADGVKPIEKGKYLLTVDTQQLGGAGVEITPEMIQEDARKKIDDLATSLRNKVITDQILPAVKAAPYYYTAQARGQRLQTEIGNRANDEELTSIILQVVIEQEKTVTDTSSPFRLIPLQDAANLGLPTSNETFTRVLQDSIESSIEKVTNYLDSKK